MPAGEWWRHAQCIDQPEWLNQETWRQLEDCYVCPVRVACLAHAIATRSTHVVMGGVKLPPRPLRVAR